MIPCTVNNSWEGFGWNWSQTYQDAVTGYTWRAIR